MSYTPSRYLTPTRCILLKQTSLPRNPFKEFAFHGNPISSPVLEFLNPTGHLGSLLNWTSHAGFPHSSPVSQED